MVISVPEVVVICAAVIGLFLLIRFNLRGQRRRLINNLYLAFSIFISVWLISVLCMWLTPLENGTAMYIWDSMSNIGAAYLPAMALMIAICFVNNGVILPKWSWLLLIVPTITVLVVWTNPLHHLHYKVFSVLASEVEFGPYMAVSGGYSYVCLLFSMIFLLRFGLKNRKMYFWQSMAICLGDLVPMVISMLATFKIANFSIAATPIAFLMTVILHGVAIYKLNFLKVTPVAIQNVLDNISDGYLIISDGGVIMDYNTPFYEMIGREYGFRINGSFTELQKSEAGNQAVIHNLAETMRESMGGESPLTYEQNIVKNSKNYSYSVEITPIRLEQQLVAFVAMFKDVTKLKENMERLRKNENMLMEREQLASLGQLIGGIAHNLKTPIMSISGSASALENLVREYDESIGDPEVTEADHHEIAGEMLEWIDKIRPACSYMSDIITVVKGQAVQMNTSAVREFSVLELIKRVELLTRHEFIKNRCRLVTRNSLPETASLHGDINNLVQVVNNLLINAIDAYQGKGGEVTFSISRDEANVDIAIADQGCGIPPEIAAKLLKEMITSKGAQGTGIGVYVSNAVIRGKFGGRIWFEENPGGGTIFHIVIPLNAVLPVNTMEEEKQ